MIIVSQDKEIMNFDNVTRIFIEDFSEDGDGFGIGADTNSAESQCWDLGYYETEQRAKEVLQEVIKCYKDTNYEYENCWCLRNLVYEMPAE